MYAEYFRLTAEPFGLTPDPAFLYLSPDHREALAAVQYGLLDGRGFITLVGEVGTGKTTLLYSLLSRLTSDVQAAYVAYTTQSFEDLLGSVLKDLGVEPAGRSKQDLLGAFNAHLVQQADAGRTVALIIDEAQNLSDQTFEELRLLSNFETYTRKLLQVVLVGQPELQDRLRRPQLRQLHERVSVRAFINPLPRQEMERYIEHRLRLVGGSIERIFSPWARRLIVWRAAGIPRRANILCHNALLFAYGRGLPSVTPAIAREVIAEMDLRRPGFWPRRALRRAPRPFRLVRWAAAIALAVLALVVADRLTKVTRSGASAVSGAVTGVPARPTANTATSPSEPAPSGAAVDPAPPAAAADVPAPAPGSKDPVAVETPPMKSDPSRAEPEVPARVTVVAAKVGTPANQPPAPHPVPVSPAAREAHADTIAVTVPPGATLLGLMRSFYGDAEARERLEAMMPDILRLNPQMKDTNMIFAGDELRLPRRVAPANTETAGRTR
jgi:general secretion pathway protein A